MRYGLASAGLVVAGLENLFTFRAQPKNNNTRRDCFSLKKICAREVKKKTRSNNQCTPNRPNPEKQKRENASTQNVKNKIKENKPSRLTYVADHGSLDFGNFTTWKLWTLDLIIANLT